MQISILVFVGLIKNRKFTGTGAAATDTAPTETKATMQANAYMTDGRNDEFG